MLIIFQKVFELENKLILLIELFSNFGLQSIFKFITKLGDGYLYLFVIILLTLSRSGNRFKFLISFIFAFLIERIVYYTLKNSIKRMRPFEKLKLNKLYIKPPDKYSFPSGHSSAAFLFATLVSYFFPELKLFLFIFAGSVGISRVILKLHFPTDILFGAFLGVLIANISIMLIF